MQIGKLSKEEREMVLQLRKAREAWPTDKLVITLQKDLDDWHFWQAQKDYEWKLIHEAFDGIIKEYGCLPQISEICEDREQDCTMENCPGFCMRFLTEEELEKCRKRAYGNEVVEEKTAEETADGDGRTADRRDIGGRGSEADDGAVGGRPQ